MKTITLPLILFLLFIAGAVRIYQANRFFYFDGDQSKDVAAVRELYETLKEGRWSNLSPVGQEGIFYYLSSFPQPPHQPNVVYNGAAYYYVLLPAAIVSSFHPFGIVVFLILLSVSSTWAMYYTGKLLVDRATGLLAALIHGISFVVLMYARFIWTPSPLLSLSALAFASLIAILKGKARFWLLLSVSVSLATQIHNSGYLLLGFAIAILLIFRPKLPPTRRLQFGTLFVFIIPFLPTVWNEIHTDLLFPKAVGYQLFTHFVHTYAGVPFWHMPFLLLAHVVGAFVQFTGMALFVGDLGHEFTQAPASEYQVLLVIQALVWIVGIVLLLVVRARERVPAPTIPRTPILVCAAILGWAALGSFIAKLYYESAQAIFWLNGVSVFIPLILFVFAVFIRFAWQEKLLRIPLIITLVSFGFLQGSAAYYTFWANTQGDIMYTHQQQALQAVSADAGGVPYGLYVHAPTTSVPSFEAIANLEQLSTPLFVEGGIACKNSIKPTAEALRTYTLVLYPEDRSPETRWVMDHSGTLIFKKRIAVYRQE